MPYDLAKFKNRSWGIMEEYKKEFALVLAETGALFFDEGLVLKDGRPTPYFVNMAMFKTGRLSRKLGSFFAAMMVSNNIANQTDIILGPSYKGSAIALSTSISLWEEYGIDLTYEYDRKEPKDHGEASKGKSLFVNNSFFPGCRIFVVDDVATSMGTKHELLEKLHRQASNNSFDYSIVGVGIGIDREQTGPVYDPQGRVILGKRGINAIEEFSRITRVPVYPVARIREIVNYLYRERIPVLIKGKRRPIDDDTKNAFDSYLDTYGTVDGSSWKGINGKYPISHK